MYIYVYVCMYIYLFIYLYVCIYTCIYRVNPLRAGRPPADEHANDFILYRRFIYKGDTSTHAQGTDPRVAWRAEGELP